MIFFMLWAGLPAASASCSDVSSSASKAVYQCPTVQAPDPSQHEKFLNGLNGTKIVFVGDSITRFVPAAVLLSIELCRAVS